MRAVFTTTASVALLALVGPSLAQDRTVVDVRVAQSVETHTERQTEIARSVVVQPSSLGAPSAAPSAANTPQVAGQTCPAAQPGRRFPGARWSEADAASLGWDEEALEAAWDAAERGHYAAGMLVYRGQVIGRFGDVARPYQTRSIRKSLLGAIIGQLVEEGRIDLTDTLAELGIDDKPALTEREKQATVRDLLMSRSGVYHDAAHMSRGDFEGRPERGTYGPGEHFWYNNWDFNALGKITSDALGADLFEQLHTRIASPIGMQDYTPSSGNFHYQRRDSIHPAYLIDMSARDRARFGLLYLNGGCWNGNQVVPAAWVATSVAPLTERSASDSPDYGYLWWSQSGVGDMEGRLIMARGANHQYITLIPEAEAVLVLVNDMKRPGWVNWLRNLFGLAPEFEDYGDVLKAVVAARPDQPAA